MAETGSALAFGIANAQERGTLFVSPGDEVYAGRWSACTSERTTCGQRLQGQEATNIRSSTADIAVKLTPPSPPSLERSLRSSPTMSWSRTPAAVRIRKAELDETSAPARRSAPSSPPPASNSARLGLCTFGPRL
ncbi:MAG: hypothetical protein U5Q44_15015, partial [Dehalococcoidia bacterium]|nr:hypothetical protein [Dehalococcoidia bacterium]